MFNQKKPAAKKNSSSTSLSSYASKPSNANQLTSRHNDAPSQLNQV